MKPLNPLVDKYLREKLGENYQQDAESKYNERSDRANGANFISNLGDVIAGNKIGSANDYFQGIKTEAKADTVGAVDKARKEYGDNLNIQKAENDNAQFDPNSESSINFRNALKANFPKIAATYGDKFNTISAGDQDLIFKPLQLQEQISARKQQAALAQSARQDAFEEKKKAALAKAQELSTTQAKAAGLYKAGSLAENQYKAATEDKKEYDPTSSGQWIDNNSWAPNWLKNDKAIETQAAKDSWIESFLRDASGAAIAPSERGAYASIYFPEPGDTESVVKNKEALRQQKMSSAGESAGIKAKQNLEQFDRSSNLPLINTDFDLNSLEEEKKRRSQSKVSKL